MKKENREFDDFVHYRHTTKPNESYFLTILDDNGLQSINLSTFGKNRITFGTLTDNDIILTSDSADYKQGYLEINEYGVLVVNTSLNIPILGNNNKPFDNVYLSEGSFIKIINDTSSSSSGVLMIMSINQNLDEWKTYPLQLGNLSIGSGNSCDIILSPSGVAKHHATIRHSLNKFYIFDEFSLNGVYVNGSKIPASTEIELKNLDVILIGNTKMILCEDKLFYQIFERGIRLDAIDIVKRVRIKFKVKEIASHVSMTINPSEFVAFLGESGAGKSTFMKCISGVDSPTSGTVLMNGENLYENYESLKYNIGYVPQDDIVFSNLTLHDMLQYAAKLRMPDNTSRKERNQRIEEVLDIVNLTDFENSYIRQLSGGQRKRASIAVELLADPNLFFLDEPTSGLDPGTERSIMKTLKQMSQMGKTIILVTHNPLNLHLCDKVAFFAEGGNLCFYGSPQDALDFFGVDDFVDIYTLINENQEFWFKKFQEIQEPIKDVEIIKNKSNNIVNKNKSFLRQLIILIKRYIKLISNDIQQLLILFLQAPFIAFLIGKVAASDLYTNYRNTKVICFSLACSAVWLGLLNSVQEICKEKVILQKEHMADLKLSAYLLSKLIVQGLLAFIQSVLLVFVFQQIVGKSQYSILISPFWDMQIMCFLSIISSVAMGLFISAIVKNTNIAMTILPLILIPNLLFSGMFMQLTGFGEFISNFILCRWALEGLGTTTNLNDLTHVEQIINPMYKMEPEASFNFTVEHMQNVIGIILLMTLVLLIGSYIFLRKNVDKNI